MPDRRLCARLGVGDIKLFFSLHPELRKEGGLDLQTLVNRTNNGRGAQYLTGEYLKVVWVEFSTIS